MEFKEESVELRYAVVRRLDLLEALKRFDGMEKAMLDLKLSKFKYILEKLTLDIGEEVGRHGVWF